jgi:Fur family iron response transcriptional regulator
VQFTMQGSSDVLSRAQVQRELHLVGLKPTAQRLRVAEILLRAPAHMTAEQILSSMRQAGGSISKATVYNTLKVLVVHGLLRQINIDPQSCVYDSKRSPHHHFHDLDSGELLDIAPDAIAFSRLPPLPEGMEAEGLEVVIRVRRKRP